MQRMRASTWLSLLVVLGCLAPGRSQAWQYEVADELATEDLIAPPPAAAHWWAPRTFSGELLWLGRTGVDEAVLLTQGIPNAQTLVVEHTPVVSFSDLAFPVEAGVRASTGFGRLLDWQPELVYSGIFDQEARVQFLPVATAGVTETTAPFFDATLTTTETDVTVAYESDLHSGELNFWYDGGWPLELLVGGRWFLQSESLTQFATQDPATGTLAEVTNNLLGAQVGLRGRLYQRERLWVAMVLKGGAYHADAELFARVDDGGIRQAELALSRGGTAYAGEIQLTGAWLITRNLQFQAGYTGLLLSEVAVLGDSWGDVSLVGGSWNFQGSSVHYHGGHLGVTVWW